jgi:hypothetical protein
MLIGKNDPVSRRIGGKELSGMEGYCLKCRTKREIKNAQSVTLKNGRPATQGVCPVCGTKITRIGKAS